MSTIYNVSPFLLYFPQVEYPESAYWGNGTCPYTTVDKMSSWDMKLQRRQVATPSFDAF